MLPYSGQIGYNDVRGEWGVGNNFSLKTASTGGYGVLNQYSFIQPSYGGNNYSPTNWYGYVGNYITQTGLFLNYDAWPTVGSYPGSGPITTNTTNPGINDGDLVNGVGWSSATGGGTWNFNGVNQYIESNNGPNPLNSFSVEIWFKAVGTFSQGSLAGQSVYNQDNWVDSNMWLLHPNATAASTTVSFYANENPQGSFSIRSATSGTLSAGNWYQIVGTFGAGGIKIYVNNALGGTGATSNSGIIDVPPNSLILAGDPRYDFRRLTGDIAIFNMYNTELSTAEISQNWNAYRGRFNL